MISWQTAAHWPYVEAPFPFYLVFDDRDEDGGAAEAGVLMRGWRIYAWPGVVIDCAMTQIGPVLRIHRYSKFKPYNKEMRSWHWATLCRNARFPLDEAGRLPVQKLIFFRSEPERLWQFLPGPYVGISAEWE